MHPIDDPIPNAPMKIFAKFPTDRKKAFALKPESSPLVVLICSP